MSNKIKSNQVIFCPGCKETRIKKNLSRSEQEFLTSKGYSLNGDGIILFTCEKCFKPEEPSMSRYIDPSAPRQIYKCNQLDIFGDSERILEQEPKDPL